jgi:hypothetical protein
VRSPDANRPPEEPGAGSNALVGADYAQSITARCGDCVTEAIAAEDAGDLDRFHLWAEILKAHDSDIWYPSDQVKP